MAKIVIKVTEKDIVKHPNDADLGKMIRIKFLKQMDKSKEIQYIDCNWVYPGP